VLKLEFEFESKDQARHTMVEVQDMFRNWNYAATDSAEYKQTLEQIDAFVAEKGKTTEEMTKD
jgi:hypothetical protein